MQIWGNIITSKIDQCYQEPLTPPPGKKWTAIRLAKKTHAQFQVHMGIEKRGKQPWSICNPFKAFFFVVWWSSEDRESGKTGEWVNDVSWGTWYLGQIFLTWTRHSKGTKKAFVKIWFEIEHFFKKWPVAWPNGIMGWAAAPNILPSREVKYMCSSHTVSRMAMSTPVLLPRVQPDVAALAAASADPSTQNSGGTMKKTRN